MTLAEPTEPYESNQQAIGAWTRFAKGAPRGRVGEAPGVTFTFANVPLAFFNMAFLSAPVLNANKLNDRIVVVKDYGSKTQWLRPIRTTGAKATPSR